MTTAKTTKYTRSLKASVSVLERELHRLTSPLLSNHTEHAVVALENARSSLLALVSLATPRS